MLRKAKNKLRALICYAIILAMVATMFPMSERKVQAGDGSSDQTVVVNLNNKHQEIKGFGGMNHPTWAGDLTASQRNTAFDNGTNQLGLSVLRIWIDSNRNNWWKELDTAKAAIAKGAIVFATPWNPPDYMREKFGTKFWDGKNFDAYRLKHDMYDEYIAHINDFVQYMRDNGVELYAVSLANEPDFGYDWTWYTETEMYNLVRYYAGSINCRVIAPESFSFLKSYYEPILNDPEALKNVEIIGTHLYGTQYKDFNFPLYYQKGAGKDLWMTEVYYPNSDNNSSDRWPEALDVSYHIHNAMINNFNTYVWWYIRRQYSFINENGTISKRGDCMAQFSKFIRPGYRRVDATECPQTGENNVDVHVSAYTGDGKAVIVAINRGSGYVSQKFEVQGGTITNVNRYKTTSDEKVAETRNLGLEGNGFWASLPGNSVSTFVCDLAGGGGFTDNGEWGVVSNGGFEAGTEGWNVQGDESTTLGIGSYTIHGGAQSLKVSGRNKTWHGAVQDITGKVFAGQTYNVKAALRYNSSENAAATGQTKFNMSIVYGDGSRTDNMGTVTIGPDTWGEINEAYTIPADADLSNVKILFETNYTGTPGAQDLVTFFIDDVSMKTMTQAELEKFNALKQGEAVLNGGIEAGTEHWEVYGDENVTLGIGSYTVHGGAQSLKVSGRSKTWHGAVQNITGMIEAGKTYEFKSAVRYNSSENANATGQTLFRMTLEYGDGTKVNVAEVTTGADAWGEMSAVYKVPEDANMESVKIIFETNYTGTPGAQDLVTFFIDDASIKKTDKTPGQATQPPVPTTQPPVNNDVNVNLSADNECYSALVSADYSGGKAKLEMSYEYSGLGVAYYINNDHSAINLADYQLVYNITSDKEYNMVFETKNNIQKNDFWDNGAETSNTQYTALQSGTHEYVFDVTGNAQAVFVKYNTYDSDTTENAKITINSIKLVKKGNGSASTPTATPTVTQAPGGNGDVSTPTATPTATQAPGGNGDASKPTVTPAPTQAPEGNGDAATPTVAPTATQAPEGSNELITPSLSETYKIGSYIYKITDIDKKTVKLYKPINKKVKKVKVVNTVKIAGVKYKVTSIDKNAFKNCKALKALTIGKNVTSIGSKAFYKCRKLTSITIKSKKLKKVGKNAFKGIAVKFKIKAPKSKIKVYKKMIKR